MGASARTTTRRGSTTLDRGSLKPENFPKNTHDDDDDTDDENDYRGNPLFCNENRKFPLFSALKYTVRVPSLYVCALRGCLNVGVILPFPFAGFVFLMREKQQTTGR